MQNHSERRITLFSKGIYFYIAFWAFLRIKTLSLGGLPDITFERIFIPLLFFGLILKNLSAKRLPLSHLFVSTVLFIIVLMLNIGLYSEGKIAALRLVFDTYFVGLLTFFVIVGFKDQYQIKPIAYACLLSGVLIALTGIGEAFHGQNFIGPVNASYEEARYFRTNGPFNDIISYGAILLLYIVAIYHFMAARIIKKRYAVPAIFLFGFGTLLTFSRADIAVLIFICILIVGGKSFLRVFFAFIGVVLAGICLYLIWDSISSSTIIQDRIDSRTIVGRWEMYKYALGLYLENPVFGIGYENFLKIRHHHFVVHNSYIQMIIEIGAFGFAFFCYYIFSILRVLKPGTIKDPELKQITRKTSLSIIAIILFIPNTVNLLHNAQFIQAAMVIMAVLFIQRHMAEIAMVSNLSEKQT